MRPVRKDPRKGRHTSARSNGCVCGGEPYRTVRSGLKFVSERALLIYEIRFAFNCNPKFIQLSTDRSNVKYGKRVTITRVAKVPNEYCVRSGKEASHKPLKYECLTSTKKRECGNQRVEEETPLAVGRSQSGCIQKKKRAVDGGLLELKTHTLGASRKAITI